MDFSLKEVGDRFLVVDLILKFFLFLYFVEMEVQSVLKDAYSRDSAKDKA